MKSVVVIAVALVALPALAQRRIAAGDLHVGLHAEDALDVVGLAYVFVKINELTIRFFREAALPYFHSSDVGHFSSIELKRCFILTKF